ITLPMATTPPFSRTGVALMRRHDLSGSVDYQIRPTSSSIPVDEKRLLLFSDRGKLSSTPGRPTVFTQERSKVFPCIPFAPGVPQGPGPAASGLDIRVRGRVEDYPDWMGA